MKYLLLFIISFFVILGCGDSKNEDQNQQTFSDSSYIFGNPDYKVPALSGIAKEQAASWTILEDFLYEVKNVNGSNYEKLQNHAKQLAEYSTSLFKDIPDTINNNQISSRLVVLETRSKLLQQVAFQSNFDTLDIQNSLKELNVAVENFIVQLNEKFEKDKIDLQRKDNEQQELKSQQKKSDTTKNK